MISGSLLFGAGAGGELCFAGVGAVEQTPVVDVVDVVVTVVTVVAVAAVAAVVAVVVVVVVVGGGGTLCQRFLLFLLAERVGGTCDEGGDSEGC